MPKLRRHDRRFFLVRWLGALLAVPAGVVAYLLQMLNMPQQVHAMHAAWWLGRDDDWAVRLIMRVNAAMGPAAARQQAARVLARGAGPDVAGLAGILAVEAGDREHAQAMLELCRAGRGTSGLVDFLEWNLSLSWGDRQHTQELCERFAKRRDLPPALTRSVQMQQMWSELLRGEFGPAARLARRILAIEPSLEANMALWVVSLHQGDAQRAQSHFDAAAGDPKQRLWFMTLGYRCLGRDGDASAVLEQLREVDATLADRARELLAPRDAREVSA